VTTYQADAINFPVFHAPVIQQMIGPEIPGPLQAAILQDI
jgi:hypothetical protein